MTYIHSLTHCVLHDQQQTPATNYQGALLAGGLWETKTRRCDVHTLGYQTQLQMVANVWIYMSNASLKPQLYGYIAFVISPNQMQDRAEGGSHWEKQRNSNVREKKWKLKHHYWNFYVTTK